jgi:hypothetical protein
MDDMPTAPAHARPRRDSLLPVLVLILAGGLLEVWASWLQIGAVSGFPHLGRVTTGWILPVTAEAYWGAALWAWLVDPAGRKSRLFAMCSAGAVFALSLAGQESDHLMAFAHRTVPPVGAAMLLTALPLTAVASGAILIHLRQVDHAEAAGAEEAARKADRAAAAVAAAADERAALRAELDAARAALEPLLADLETARNELGRVTAKADDLERKMAAQRKRNSPAKKRATSPRSRGAGSRATEVPDDVDARAEALAILAAEPGISGADLGLRVGKSKRWGQLFKTGLATTAAPKGQDPEDSP